jgi:4-amino-4-deoxy-L-arabinose transferase-like glycosyltransferase
MITKANIILTLLLAAFAVQSYGTIRSKSPTWDETNYFGLGYYLLQHPSWDIPSSTLHPPLSYYLNSFPLLWYDADERAWDLPPALKGLEKSNLSIPGAGLRLLTDRRYPMDRLLILARVPTLFLALLLGFCLFRWTKELYGELPALYALFLFSLCPNMIAHSGLITPDMALTCLTFISCYCLWKVLRRGGGWIWIIACSLSLGCALLSKYSALLQVPVFIIAAASIFFSSEDARIPDGFPFSRWLNKKEVQFKWMRLSILLLFIVLLALFVLSLGYRFQLHHYFRGVTHQLLHAEGGHPSFLLGMYSKSGWWYYYFIAFLLKTPIPLLVMLLTALLFYFKGVLRGTPDLLFMLAPVAVYFIFFSINHQSIGLRYILPAYPFLFMLAGTAAGAVNVIRGRIWRYIILVVLFGWYLIGTITIYPHYLAYFNEAAGGPDNGYRYLVDSNLDWGQDLKGLALYLKEKSVDRIHLSYFGTADPSYYGIRYEWMPSYYLPEDYRGGNERMRSFTFPTTGMVAISATNLQNVYFSDKQFYDWLKQYKPIVKIGYSIFIYDLDQIR